MSEAKISRRSLLKGAGLGVGATVVGAFGGPVGASEGDAVFGVIEQIIAPSRTVLLRTPDTVAVVQLSEDALLWKDRQTTLESFVPGDEVSVEGEAIGDVVRGRVMKSILRVLEGPIEARNGRLLTVSSGVIEVSETTQWHEGGGKRATTLAQLKIGDVVSAIGRNDSSSGFLVAAKIGILQSA